MEYNMLDFVLKIISKMLQFKKEVLNLDSDINNAVNWDFLNHSIVLKYSLCSQADFRDGQNIV